MILAVVSIAAGLPSVANATLADDSDTIIAGSFSISQTTSPKFFSHIDYAVYAPGNYSGSYSFPNEYVYCYQLSNDSTSTSNILSFTINIDPDASVDITNYDAASLSGIAGGINPAFYAYSRDQVQYLFSSHSNPFNANQHSSVLIFTSDFAPDPIMGTGYLDTTAGDFSVQIPVPTPEPASLLLLTLASPFLLKTRRHKQS